MSHNRMVKPSARRPELAVDPNRKTAKFPNGKPESPNKKPMRRAAMFGLFQRREKWTLSRRGWFVTLAACAVVALATIFWVHPFLAVTDRVETQYLVVEGWIPNYALEESIAEFKARPYKMIFTVGADPLNGIHVEEGDSIATQAYERLKWMGVSADAIQPVPAHIKYRNRTFESAVALRKWIEENHVPMASFNLVTVGPHARRSRMLFEKAFEDKAHVGIISVENREYDPKRWWKYSEGVKEVIGEGVGYVYARFFFHPSKQ